MSTLLGTLVAMGGLIAVGWTVMFVEFLGAVRTLEIVAFTRNSGKGNRQDEQGEKFHLGAS